MIKEAISKVVLKEDLPAKEMEEVMEEITTLVPLYAGVTYAGLEESGIQWALRNGRKRKFFPVDHRGPVEKPNDRYPLWIIPRGFHYPYGIGTTVTRAEGLAKVFAESRIEIHPEDAKAAGIEDGDRVKVISPRGEVETLCHVSEGLPKGVAYLATTFFPVFSNDLLISGRESVSPTVEYKVLIGRVEKR